MTVHSSLKFCLAIGLLFWTGSPLARPVEPAYPHWARILQQFACSEGVRYADLKASGKISLVEQDFRLSATAFASLDSAAQMAYLINLYNARTVALIVENYPVRSIRDLKEPWKRRFIPLFGDTLSLDDLEHQWLRRKYREPRIHVALNCASVSCPPLQTMPFRGATLEAQLESALNAFLRDGKRNRIQGGVVQASRLFEWYGDDFKGKYGSWKSLLTQRMGLKVSKDSLATISTVFLEYDWNLNDDPKCQAK